MTWRQVDGAYMSVGLGDLIAGAYTPISRAWEAHMGTGGRATDIDRHFFNFIF